MRGKHEGCIYKITRRGKPKWRVQLTLENGKRSQREFRAEREAIRYLHDANHRKARGLRAADSDQKLRVFLRSVWLPAMKQTIRASTFESYSQIVENHLIPGLGEVPLSKLTPQKVTAFLTDRHENGTRSAEHLRRVLRNALGFAMRHELIFRNVASLASCPKKEPKPPKFLTVDEAKRFLSAVKGHRLEALYAVALACGLRFSEALGLSWEDVNLDARTLTVRKQLGRRGKGFSAPKSKSALRTVPIPGFAVEALKDHRLRQELQHRPLAGSRWKETGLVFTSTIGTPCEGRNVRRDLYRILRENGLPAIRFHDLRHSCATLLLAQGVDPRTIMQILGHSQITLTLQTYSHVLPTLTQDAADKMNGLLADG